MAASILPVKPTTIAHGEIWISRKQLISWLQGFAAAFAGAKRHAHRTSSRRRRAAK